MTYRYAINLIICFLLFACNEKSKAPTTDMMTPPKEKLEETTALKTKKILFFGDSLTAGYGLDEQESFPSLIQDRIDSLDLSYEVINAGLSGETTAGGKGRIGWVLTQPIDIFILELGANDMLRGLNLTQTNDNLRDILDEVKSTNPEVDIIIAGMEAPPNMGDDYTNEFRSIFSVIAKDYNASLIPFLLDKVAGISDLTLGDAKHPNAEGQKIVRDNVWKVLKGHL